LKITLEITNSHQLNWKPPNCDIEKNWNSTLTEVCILDKTTLEAMFKVNTLLVEAFREATRVCLQQIPFLRVTWLPTLKTP
jgi:hypothetical protein